MNKEKLRKEEISKIKKIRGKVKWYNISKRFGFIEVEGEETDYFVHDNNVVDTSELLENDIVEFTPSENRKGKIALEVRVIG